MVAVMIRLVVRTAVMLLATIAVKLSWGDYTSWLTGIAMGCISGALWIYIGWRRNGQLRRDTI
jgi:hypothetical protein